MKRIKQPLTAEEMKEMVEKKGRIEVWVELGEDFLKLDDEDKKYHLESMICEDDKNHIDLEFEVLENHRGTLTIQVIGEVV